MPHPPDHSGLLIAAKREHDQAIARSSAAARELEAARRARDHAHNQLIQSMHIARKGSMTWAAIGKVLGITAQAASQMFKRGMGE